MILPAAAIFSNELTPCAEVDESVFPVEISELENGTPHEARLFPSFCISPPKPCASFSIDVRCVVTFLEVVATGASSERIDAPAVAISLLNCPTFVRRTTSTTRSGIGSASYYVVGVRWRHEVEHVGLGVGHVRVVRDEHDLDAVLVAGDRRLASLDLLAAEAAVRDRLGGWWDERQLAVLRVAPVERVGAAAGAARRPVGLVGERELLVVRRPG
jgi:hypothetical protein